MDNLEKRTVEIEIIGKTERTKGLIFKKPEYLIAFKVVDKNVTFHPIGQHELSFPQYSALKVGDKVGVTMYSKNKHTWFFSIEDLNFFETYKDRL